MKVGSGGQAVALTPRATSRGCRSACSDGPSSRISAPARPSNSDSCAGEVKLTTGHFLSFQSLFYNIVRNFFIFPKFCSNFYFRISLYIFFLIFLFQNFNTNACLQKFLPRYFCVLFSLPQISITIFLCKMCF